MALSHIKANGTYKNAPRAPRPRKTTDRMSVADPFRISNDIRSELSTKYAIDISSRTVRRRLSEKNLLGCIVQHKPHVSKKNLKSRISFAREHLDKPIDFWKNVLWSDESKFCRFGSDGKRYVWRPPNMQYNPKYTSKTVKHGGGNVMVWAAFSGHGVGLIRKIDTRMDQNVYKNILVKTIITNAEANMPPRWRFMHNNDPKHTSRTVKCCLEENQIEVLKWPAQSPDLNPIENLWNDIEKHITTVKPKNLNDLWTEIQKAWYDIPKERCMALVESMPRRCAAVIQNKGYPTKY